MKSGLEGRNNQHMDRHVQLGCSVSMKSGLEGRNNKGDAFQAFAYFIGLNEVRPRRPEQYVLALDGQLNGLGLNEVRPRRPEQ